MALFRNRPLASALCCFLIASLIGVKLTAHIKILLLLLAFSVSLLFIFRVMWKRECSVGRLCLILCLLCASLAFLQSWRFFDLKVGNFSDYADKEMTVEGYVCEKKSVSGNSSRFIVQLDEVDGERTSAKVLLECRYLSALKAGDRFRLTGQVRLPRNSVLYNEGNTLYPDGLVGIITCNDYESCTILDEKTTTIKHWFSKIQKDLSFRLHDALDGEEGAVASALFLGDRSYLSEDTELAFRRGGVSHLLALSGLHISILFLLLDAFLKILPLKKNPRTILVFVGIVIYLFITGCSPSTLRAVSMLGVLYLAYFCFGQDYDGFTTLSIIAFLIVFVTPYSVYDLSFWMSFVATAGILIFMPTVSELYKNITNDREIPKWIRKTLWIVLNAIAVGCFANVAILPLSAYLFGSTSVLSVGLTMVLSPFISLALLFSALTLVFPYFVPITFLAKNVFKCLMFFVSWSANLSNVVVLLNGRFTSILLASLTLLLVLFAVMKLKQKGWLLLPILLSGVILVVGYADVLPKDMGIVSKYISTGGSEALVLAEGKTAIAIDFSSGGSTITSLICNTVTDLKCTEVEELVLTHYHTQSTSQINLICGQIKLRRLRLPVPNDEHDAAIAARLEQEAALHNVQVIYGTENPSHPDVEIVYYHAMTSENRTENAILFAMDICGQRVSYMNSDIWQGEIAHLVRDAALTSDLFIFGAHGSKSKISASFFDNLQNTRRIIFGYEELYEICPRELLTKEYWVEPSSKQFSFSRTAQQ